MAKIINLKSAEGLGTATVDDVLKGVTFTSENGIALKGTLVPTTAGVSSYLTLVDTNASADAIDAALGKNNEENITGVGNALAMYACFKDETLNIDADFPNLIQCQSIFEIFTNDNAFQEANNNENINALLMSAAYTSENMEFLGGKIYEISTSGTYDFSKYSDYGNIDICIIGGGGAGAVRSGGAGGGAGAFMTNVYDVKPSMLNIVIGAGGASNGASGEATTVSSSTGETYSAEGGGGGKSFMGGSGGTGGGAMVSTGGSNGSDGASYNATALGGTGDGLSKYPWGDESLTLYCGGGGGCNGSAYSHHPEGGAGGGGGGSSNGKAGTLYGAGGGGAYSSGGGAGYQGAVFIRKHVV